MGQGLSPCLGDLHPPQGPHCPAGLHGANLCSGSSLHLFGHQVAGGPATGLSPPRLACPVGPLEPHSAPSTCREEPVREFTGKVAPADVLDVLCRERASFERVTEPLQPQARALLALQWGLLSTPRQK